MRPILIIDDSPSVQNILKRLLSPLERPIQLASNGVEGLRAAASDFPGLITLDLNMPQLNGASVLKAMDLLNLRIPVLLITGSAVSAGKFQRFSNLAGFCLKSELRERLLPMAQEALKDDRSRIYADLDFPLDQDELFSLLAPRERKRILLVDDSQTMLNLFTRELSRTGLYDLFTAHNGQEGLMKAAMLRPDLILCDVDMPQLDGPSMAQMLYIMGHPFPILFISAIQDREVVERARSLKAVQGYLDKERLLSEPEELHRQLESFLKIGEAERVAWNQAYQKVDLDRLVRAVQGGLIEEMP
ncbi:MAG: response regulator [bacterium]|nr:response regulator [bacterium]